MRQLRRPSVTLPTLAGTGAGAKEAASRAEDWETNGNLETVIKDFPPHWGKADVRGALYAMHGRACAYCQRFLPGNDRGAVEHFRPKSFYWWLAYVFENFLLSCTPCNSYKLDYFPLFPGTKPVDYEGRHHIHLEKRLLLNPVDDSMEPWIRVDFNALGRNFDEVRRKGIPVTIMEGLPVDAARKCQETIKRLKLNINSDLMAERLDKVEEVKDLIRLTHTSEGDLAKSKLKKIASRYASHSYIVRDLLERFDASLIPNRTEELEGLVKDFLRELSIAKSVLEHHPKERATKTRMQRVCWALAVLWKDPPIAPPSQVKAWIQAEKLLAEIQPYYDKL